MSTSRPFEFFVQWHLTENCNLWCRHCYQGERGTDELSTAQVKNVIREVSDMIDAWSEAYEVSFSRSMNITGGEPFLRSDLSLILAEVARRGFEIFLLTNGTLVTQERAQQLADIGVRGVQVSMEGPEEIHDEIRGKGSFTAAAAGIEALVDAGLEVTLNVTLSRLNASSIKQVVAYGSHAGVRKIGFSRLVPAGKGRFLVSQMLMPSELKTLYQSLLSLEIKALQIVSGDPIASQLKLRRNGDSGSRAISGCSAGVSGITILPNGTVTPCRRLPISLGNVTKNSLREIWATSPVLEALRDRSRYRGKCGSCSRWAVCRGCRAIAYASARGRGEDDFLADDPQCFF